MQRTEIFMKDTKSVLIVKVRDDDMRDTDDTTCPGGSGRLHALLLHARAPLVSGSRAVGALPLP